MTDAYTASVADVYARLDVYADTLKRARQDTRAAIDASVAEVRQALEAGVPLNLSECARRTGIAKQTLYSRLPPRLIADRRGDPEVTDAPA